MPRFSEAFRAGLSAGRPIVPFASVAWGSGTKHYGVSPRRIGGLGLDPRLIGGAAVTSTVPIKPGSLSFPGSSIVLADGDGEVTALLEAGEDPAGVDCSMTWAMPGVDLEDWFTLLSGLFSFANAEDGGYSQRLNIRANDRPLQGDADKILFLPAEFPKAPPATWNTFFPMIYGRHSAENLHGKGMMLCIPWSIDATEGYRVTPTMGHASAVPRVYKNGTLLTLSTDYDLSYPVRGKLFTSIDLAAAITADDIIACDIDGMTDVYDGTGSLITNIIDIFKHWLANRAFGSWRYGAWNGPEDYPIDLESFARAAGFASSFLPSGSARFGGAAEPQTIADGMQKFLGTAPCFRPYWTETSQLALSIRDHRFHGFTSPGFDSDVPAVYIRGRTQEIGVSFDDSEDVENLLSRVNLTGLFGLDADGRTEKGFQSIAVEDVSQQGAAAESFDLAYSEATLE
jgi:hypothetical protein